MMMVVVVLCLTLIMEGANHAARFDATRSSPDPHHHQIDLISSKGYSVRPQRMMTRQGMVRSRSHPHDKTQSILVPPSLSSCAWTGNTIKRRERLSRVSTMQGQHYPPFHYTDIQKKNARFCYCKHVCAIPSEGQGNGKAPQGTIQSMKKAFGKSLRGRTSKTKRGKKHREEPTYYVCEECPRQPPN